MGEHEGSGHGAFASLVSLIAPSSLISFSLSAGLQSVGGKASEKLW